MDAAVDADFSLQDITHREQIAFLQDLPPIGAPLSLLSLTFYIWMSNSPDWSPYKNCFTDAHSCAHSTCDDDTSGTCCADGDKSAHTGFQIWLITLFFVTFFDGIHDTIGRVSTQLLNRQGSDFQEHLHEIEQELSHNLDLISLDHTLLHQIHDAGRTDMVVMYRWNQDTSLFDMTKCLGRGNPIISIQAKTLVEHFRYGKHIHKARSSSPKHFTPPPELVIEELDQMNIDIFSIVWRCAIDGFKTGIGGFTQIESTLQQLLNECH